MILDEIEVKERIESPSNLLNRLKSAITPHKKNTNHPSFPPTSNEIIENLEEKISYGSAKSKAIGIMTEAMDELKSRLPEVQKPEKLAAIAADMGKLVNSMQVRAEGETKIGQIIIYSPTRVSESEFDVIDVRGSE